MARPRLDDRQADDEFGREKAGSYNTAQIGAQPIMQQATAKRLGWESTLRAPGCPKRLRPDR